MQGLAPGVTAFAAETSLIFACYSVKCKIVLNAMGTARGEQHDRYPRKKIK